MCEVEALVLEVESVGTAGEAETEVVRVFGPLLQRGALLQLVAQLLELLVPFYLQNFTCQRREDTQRALDEHEVTVKVDIFFNF